MLKLLLTSVGVGTLAGFVIYQSSHLFTHISCVSWSKKLINLTCLLYPKQFLLNSVWFWFHFGPYPLTGLHHCPHVSPFCDHLHLHICDLCSTMEKRAEEQKQPVLVSRMCGEFVLARPRENRQHMLCASTKWRHALQCKSFPSDTLGCCNKRSDKQSNPRG